jgi:hypothetical protein
VAVALSAAVHGTGTRTKRWLEQMVEARIKDAQMVGPPPGIPGLEAYANNTTSTLLYLLLDLSEVDPYTWNPTRTPKTLNPKL